MYLLYNYSSVAHPTKFFLGALVVLVLSVSTGTHACAQPMIHSANGYQKIVNRKPLPLIPIAIFGKDQRRKLPPRYKRLKSQIGLLHNPRSNTLCTAFCVGPNIIATASHCLFGQTTSRRYFLSDLMFKLKAGNTGPSHSSKLAGSRLRQSRQFILTGTSKLNKKPPIGAVRDWALARLDHPICNNGWFKTVSLSHQVLQKASNEKKLFQVAYHMDFRNWQLAFSRSCAVARDFGKLKWKNIKKHFSSPRSLVLHRCDTGEASSGSPLLLDTDKGPVVVAINVGTYQQRNIIVKNGRIIHRSKFRTIANTAVNSTAFSKKIKMLENASVLLDRSDLKILQTNLKEQGLYQSKIDGIYGNRTERAVKAFERRTNRPVTGLATREILDEFTKNSAGSASIQPSSGHSLPR